MEIIRRSSTLTLIICFALLAAVCFGNFTGGSTSHANADSGKRRHDKVSSELRERLAGGRLKGEEEISVILQLQGAESEELTALLGRKGARHKDKFQNLNAQAISIPASALDEVESVTSDARFARSVTLM